MVRDIEFCVPLSINGAVTGCHISSCIVWLPIDCYAAPPHLLQVATGRKVRCVAVKGLGRANLLCSAWPQAGALSDILVAYSRRAAVH